MRLFSSHLCSKNPLSFTPWGYINNQIDEIGISQMTLNIIAQLSPPSPARKDLEIHTFIMIIKTIWADWVIKGDTFLSHVSICFDFLSGTCKNFLLIFFFFLSPGFFVFFFLLLHLYFLRCCSLEIFPQTADTCGDGAHIVQIHRDLPCRVRTRLLASHKL